MKELYKALLAVHNEMPQVGNNAVNGHFRSEYCTLDHLISVVKPIFLKHGIIPSERCYDGKVALQLIHAGTGEADGPSEIELVCKDPTNPQQQKSAETYARRRLWQLKAGICPAGEDDDANAASDSKVTQKAQQKPANEQPVQGKVGLPWETIEAFGDQGEIVLKYLVSIGSIPQGGGFEDVRQFRDQIITNPAKVVAAAKEEYL